MTYKTILVHCNDKRRVGRLLVPAVDLARQFQSHLVGLSVVPPLAVISSGVEAPPIVVDAQCQIYREEVPAMREAFDAATRDKGFTTEWRDAEAGPLGVVDVVLEHGRATDLIVASQSDPDWPAGQWLNVADRLAIESGRPVLIIPNSEPSGPVGRRVLVAWNGRREAVRAVFDALPILMRAEQVDVVWVNPQSEEDSALAPPAYDICTTLSRHGVKCEKTQHLRSQSGVAESLVDRARAVSADLLVMGCYGHSRLREFVFGGASRYILAQMPIPVLMSH